jgi:hypothetical protein
VKSRAILTVLTVLIFSIAFFSISIKLQQKLINKISRNTEMANNAPSVESADTTYVNTDGGSYTYDSATGGEDPSNSSTGDKTHHDSPPDDPDPPTPPNDQKSSSTDNVDSPPSGNQDSTSKDEDSTYSGDYPSKTYDDPKLPPDDSTYSPTSYDDKDSTYEDEYYQYKDKKDDNYMPPKDDEPDYPPGTDYTGGIKYSVDYMADVDETTMNCIRKRLSDAEFERFKYVAPTTKEEIEEHARIKEKVEICFKSFEETKNIEEASKHIGEMSVEEIDCLTMFRYDTNVRPTV